MCFCSCAFHGRRGRKTRERVTNCVLVPSEQARGKKPDAAVAGETAFDMPFFTAFNGRGNLKESGRPVGALTAGVVHAAILRNISQSTPPDSVSLAPRMSFKNRFFLLETLTDPRKCEREQI